LKILMTDQVELRFIGDTIVFIEFNRI
jgi:hypothetical protein